MEPTAESRRRLRAEEDLISSLPDELLHTILIRLPSATEAARTSVLSRRWRGVWAHMPELVLGGGPAASTPPSALLDSISTALNSYTAPTLSSLRIDVTGAHRRDVPAHRIAPWLRFASERLAGNLSLSLDLQNPAQWSAFMEEQLALPVCDRATEIDLDFLAYDFFLRAPPTGSFSSLTDLRIACAQMDGGELGCLVSSPRCPRLRKLCLFLSELAPVRDVSIRSESLECFRCSSGIGKLEVTAPMLQEITFSQKAVEACIVAPKLQKVEWIDPYDPAKHQFAVAGRHLRSLSIMHSTWLGILISSTQLMERFDTASELTVSLGLLEGIAGYVTFLKEMDKLPVCETLVVYLMTDHHALAAVMLHLLRRCRCIRKLKLYLDQHAQSNMASCTTSGCPCLLPESYRMNDITFESLEEIGISFFTGSDEQAQFMKLLLSRCNMATLKRVNIMVQFAPVSSEVMEAVETIRNMCNQNSKVQFNVVAMEPPK